MFKKRILIFIFMYLSIVLNAFAMQQEYTMLSLPEELNLEILKFKINEYVKEFNCYADRIDVTKKINMLKLVSKNFNKCVDKVLVIIKQKLDQANFIDLDLTYKFNLF